MSEEKQVDDQHEAPKSHQCGSPIREAALRNILARDLSLIEPGLQPFDPEHGAEEYTVAVGRIDLFCRDRDGNPVVIELKKEDACDPVVGQLARYVGYVREHHLTPSERLRGLIISHTVDETLRYAIKAIPNAELFTYEVDVRVRRYTG